MSETSKLTESSGEHQSYKSISAAQKAYRDGDVEASRAQHMLQMHVESHSSSASDYVKSIVFGGLDGITTTFAIIAAAAGSNADFVTVLIFGFSNVLADGFSMGFGEWISGSAEMDHARTERAREEWEVDNAFDLEVDEMVQVYEAKGLTHDEACTIVEVISRDKKRFVDFMMVEELGLLVDLDDVHGPMKQGAVMFCSFIAFGLIPLMAYMSGHGRGLDIVFVICCCLTGVGLLLLGSVKGYLTGMSIVRAALLMLFNGFLTGSVSFWTGFLVENSLRTGPM